MSTPQTETNPYPFKTQLEVGKQGEELFWQLLRDEFRNDWRGHVDARNDTFYQRQDIDYVVNQTTYEVKTDTNVTGNFFLEHEQNGKPGALYQSRAMVWFYYFPRLSRAFLINLPELQKWTWAMCKPTDMRAVKGGKAFGFIVPIDRLTQESFVQEVFFDEQTEKGGDNIRERRSSQSAEEGAAS